VEMLDLEDDPDLVVIQVYITSAYRAYAWQTTIEAEARMCAWEVCTLPLYLKKPASTPILSF